MTNNDKKYYSNLWNSIDSEKAQHSLDSLQEKLAIASKERDWSKVKQLQQSITDSIEIRCLVVKKVIQENGRRPGVDGILWVSDSDKAKGAMSLVSDDYEAKPFRRVVIQDKNKMKERHIGIPTIKDRCMISLYSLALDPIAESTADKKSFAFRKGKSALDAHSFICDAIRYPDSPEWILAADVKSCYESISHDWIMTNIPINKKILRSFLKAGFIFGKELFPTEHGISLGMSISPIIANMSLDGLQKVIFDLQSDQFHIDYSNGNFVRYADDIIVTSRTKEFAIKIKSAIEQFLSVRGMKLSEKKTKIVHVSQGFEFLSRHYCKRDGIFCVTPSDKAVKAFEDNLRDFILNSGKQMSQRSLIKGINARLHGWAGYHRVEQSYDVFRHIDCIVSSLLLKLMKEIFPSKSKKQIIETYWYEEPDGRKVFSLPQRRDIRVIRMKDIILIDHKKVVLNKNPYIDKEYFESRLKLQDIQKVNGDFKSIWKRQRGRCFYCGRKLFEDQQKRLIHINSLDDNSIENLAYIHETCSQKEAEFIETDIENPTETDVFEIIDEISENKADYSKLKKYLSKRKERKFALTFQKIEKILGQEISSDAYKSKSYWFSKRSKISSSWQSSGFEIFAVDLRKQKVFFHKSKKVSKLSIPEIFLTDKIPNDAKYELEQFFRYIRKKYGI